MHFAKLFDFPTGQLLVEREWVALGASGAGYSSLVTKTKLQPYGCPAVTATAKTVYPTTQECAEDFAAFDEAQAVRVFAAHQDYLHQGREITFSTNHTLAVERPKSLMSPASSPMVVPELLEEFIKELFLTYRVGKIELSAEWLAKALGKATDCRGNAQEVRWYLTDKLGLKPSALPKRIRVPIEADYTQLDAQGHPQITAFHAEVARSYTLLVQDWLTEEELHLFASPVLAT